MTKMSEYFKKLQDPRWQKKRLEIFERDGWKCLCCMRSSKTLQVHHLVYTGKDPWDEPSENLETLCTECHEWREDFNKFSEGRTSIPTALCFAFCIFSGKYYQRMKNRPEKWTPLKEFAVFWHRVENSTADDTPNEPSQPESPICHLSH